MTMRIVAGIDLGGTAVNYTFLDESGQFLIEALCEHPARSVEGPAVCLQQIADGLILAAERAGIRLADVVAVGLDTPGRPAPPVCSAVAGQPTSPTLTGRATTFGPVWND